MKSLDNYYAIYPTIEPKNQINKKYIRYLRDLETGELTEIERGDIPVTLIPPDSIEGITSEKESNLSDEQLKALKLEYGENLDGTGYRQKEIDLVVKNRELHNPINSVTLDGTSHSYDSYYDVIASKNHTENQERTTRISAKKKFAEMVPDMLNEWEKDIVIEKGDVSVPTGAENNPYFFGWWEKLKNKYIKK